MRASAPLIDGFRPLEVTGEIIRGVGISRRVHDAPLFGHIPPVVKARMIMCVKSGARVGTQYVRGCTTLSLTAMIFVMESW